jgi:hypothetical protein
VVVGHRSPFSSGWHGSHERTQKLLVPVLERFGVDLALFGHDHNYERTRPIGGVTYIITGGGGRGTRRVQPSSITAVASRVAHFVYVEADARALRAVAIDAEGTPFDSMRLESH